MVRPLLPFLLVSVLASPPPAVADWRSFLHGDPPQARKAPPPKQRAVVSTAPGVVRDLQVEEFLGAFADALMARDGKPMLVRLSDRYAIEGLPEGVKARDVFLQATGRIAGPTEMIVQSVERRSEERTARVEFRYRTADPKLKTLHFDATGRLLASDLFATQVHRHGS